MRTAVINQESIVVDLLAGSIDKDQEIGFVSHFAPRHGVVSFVRVDENRPVWIGGSYDATSGEFSPPPSPEPEVIVEETMNDDAPII